MATVVLDDEIDLRVFVEPEPSIWIRVVIGVVPVHCISSCPANVRAEPRRVTRSTRRRLQRAVRRFIRHTREFPALGRSGTAEPRDHCDLS